MMQISAYFKHMQIVQKLEPQKFLLESTHSFSHSNFSSIMALDMSLWICWPRVIAFMVIEACTMSRKIEFALSVSQGVWLKGLGKFENSNFEILFQQKIWNYMKICTSENFLLYSIFSLAMFV